PRRGAAGPGGRPGPGGGSRAVRRPRPGPVRDGAARAPAAPGPRLAGQPAGAAPAPGVRGDDRPQLVLVAPGHGRPAARLPVPGYVCWSITSNREWGLPFLGSSDFGLFHVDLDGDPELRRTPTAAATVYAAEIACPQALERLEP